MSGYMIPVRTYFRGLNVWGTVHDEEGYGDVDDIEIADRAELIECCSVGDGDRSDGALAAFIRHAWKDDLEQALVDEFEDDRHKWLDAAREEAQ